MSNPNATNFWLPINKEAWKAPVSDLLATAQVSVPTGCAIQFNFAFYQGTIADANLMDLSNYTAIRVSVLAPDLSATYIDMQIPNASFGTCTTAEFEAFTAAQLQIFIPAAQNVLTTTNGAPGNYILRVYGIDADAATDPDILCLFQISAYNTGIAQNPQSPLPTKVGTKLSFVCAWDNLTRDLTLIQTPNGQVTTTISAPYNGPGQASYSMQLNGGLFYDLSLALDSGQVTLAINQAGHS